MEKVLLITLSLLLLMVYAHHFWVALRSEKEFARYPMQETGKINKLPFFSILISAYNEEKVIVELLESLRALDYPHYEVLMTCDRSSDGTSSILRAYQQKHPGIFTYCVVPACTDGAHNPKANALHHLAAKARGEYLIFTDADVVFHPFLLRVVAANFAIQGVDLLSGYGYYPASGLLQQFLAPITMYATHFYTPADQLNNPSCPVSLAIGAFIAVSADSYRRTGGFGHPEVCKDLHEDSKLAYIYKQSNLVPVFVDLQTYLTIRNPKNWQALHESRVRHVYQGAYLMAQNISKRYAHAIALGMGVVFFVLYTLPWLVWLGFLIQGDMVAFFWLSLPLLIAGLHYAYMGYKRSFSPLNFLFAPITPIFMSYFFARGFIDRGSIFAKWREKNRRVAL